MQARLSAHIINCTQATELLDGLCRRRLAMRFDEGYVAVGGTT